MAQQVLNLAASKYLQRIDTAQPEDLNCFVYYLEKVRKVSIVDARAGSLIITVESTSLEILEDLWKDYCTGHAKISCDRGRSYGTWSHDGDADDNDFQARIQRLSGVSFLAESR